MLTCLFAVSDGAFGLSSSVARTPGCHMPDQTQSRSLLSPSPPPPPARHCVLAKMTEKRRDFKATRHILCVCQRDVESRRCLFAEGRRRLANTTAVGTVVLCLKGAPGPRRPQVCGMESVMMPNRRDVLERLTTKGGGGVPRPGPKSHGVKK